MALEESILKSTKKKLNVDPDDLSFDLDIIDHINTAFSHLQQLGLGPDAGFQIEDDTANWADLFTGEPKLPILNALKTNVYLRVRLIFDPPEMSHLLAALERQIQESDWRLNVMREETEWVDPDPPDLLIVDGGDPSGA